MDNKLESEKINIISAEKIESVSEWLHLLFNDVDDSILFPPCCFPSDNIKRKYLENINTKSEFEIKKILRLFLIESCELGADDTSRNYYLSNIQDFKNYKNREYLRRLFTEDKTWEGITWVIDLLNISPQKAIDVISAYFLVHCQHLPDFRFDGLLDAMEIIRTRYIEKEYSSELFLNMNPNDFEFFIAALLKEMKYNVRCTKKSYDKGIDIECFTNKDILKGRIIVQCKRSKNNIGIKDIREFYGVIMSEKATKGLFITTSKFTNTAVKFAMENPSIELLNDINIIRLCNENFGINWPNQIDRIILNIKVNNKI